MLGVSSCRSVPDTSQMPEFAIGRAGSGHEPGEGGLRLRRAAGRHAHFGFFIGDIANPALHSVYELFAAIVISLIATVLKFGDRTPDRRGAPGFGAAPFQPQGQATAGRIRYRLPANCGFGM